ncbi:septum formation family protein [Blastococcus sp. SYSU D00669]
MRRSGWTLAAAAVLLLGGCTSTVTGQAAFGGEDPAKPEVPPAGLGGPDPGADPVVGTCYTIAPGQQDDPLDPPPPVECAGEHNAETAAVDDGPFQEGDPYPSAAEVEDPDGAIATALEDICTFDVLTEYLGGDDLDDPYAFFAPYLPNQEQWDAGARWVRCDVFYGYTEPEPAPGVIAGALEGSDAAAYRACFVGTPETWDVVPCSQPHDAEPIGAYADVDDDAPYPADVTARQALAQQCTADAQAYIGGTMPIGYAVDVYVGSQVDWQESGPLAQCVLVPAGGGRTSTSVRG